jgi:hypothetical protein
MTNSESHSPSGLRIAAAWYAALQSRRRLIIVVVAIVTVLASVREFASSAPEYRAEAHIEVTSVALSTDARFVSAIGDLRFAIPRTYPPKIYEDMLQSPAVVDQVIERLVVEGHFEEADVPAIDDFSRDVKLYVDVIDQTTRPVTYSPIIRLTAKAKTPELCIALLEAWTDIVIDVANNRLAANVRAKSETLAAQGARLESELRELREQLQIETSAWNLDLIQKEIELAQKRQDLLIQARQIAEQDSSAASRQLAALSAQLSSEEPFLEYRKAPSDDAYFMSKDSSPGDSEDTVANDVMLTQEENITYTNLKTHAIESQATQASADARIETLDAQIELVQEHLDTQTAVLSEHSIVQTRLEAEIEIAQKVYADIAKESSFSDIALSLTNVSGESGERAVGLNRISNRIVPTENSGTLSRIFAVLIAGFTAFSMTAIFLLVNGVALPALRNLSEDRA